jgi:hypothetical protein
MTDNISQPIIRRVNVGNKTIVSKAAYKKLQELGFDPIEEMVKMFDKLEKDIYDLQYYPSGIQRDNYSSVKYAALLSTKQKLITDLLRYGYARAPESVEISATAIRPMEIRLNGLTINQETLKEFDKIEVPEADTVYLPSKEESLEMQTLSEIGAQLAEVKNKSIFNLPDEEEPAYKGVGE